MGKSNKPHLFEYLTDLCDPWDAAEYLRWFADRVDEQAGKLGITELQYFQVAGVLGVDTLVEFRDLARFGLRIYRREGTWYVDSRDFRKWALARSERLSRKPRNPQSQPRDHVQTSIPLF
ncbi:hypothetical protein BLI708_06625 [Bifidobacterium imperatoris]|uniref:Uncharacterized protein n=1 Tax=Bifidobacterium imperatoris TaxID=2020965 RepID=A0A2N5IQW9_9BIFI|nr:hypothetical protein [Bifidobacterium imperatoris]PLS24351.1 hypothetical protein Tam1G_1614 [Bifidobacterium imperatoris]QSY56947.1 hypothetical protein BLI708_06625 [Bifidobacterium imperatoris]